MPFFEFIWDGFLFILLTACIVAAMLFIGGYFLGLLGLLLMLGWIPILACASDPDWVISFDGIFVERAAAWATVVYLVSGCGLFVLWMTVSDRDGLPHGLKSLAFLFPHPAESHVRKAILTGERVDRKAVADVVRFTDLSTRWSNQMRTYNSRTLAKDAAAEAERVRADKELLDATAEMERARGRLEEAKKRVRK